MIKDYFSVDNLPFELPLLQAVGVYLRRLSVITIILLFNILIFGGILWRVSYKNSGTSAEPPEWAMAALLLLVPISIFMNMGGNAIYIASLKNRYATNLEVIAELTQQMYLLLEAPTVDRMTHLLDSQDQINKDLAKNVIHQEKIIEIMSRELRDRSDKNGEKKNNEANAY